MSHSSRNKPPRPFRDRAVGFASLILAALLTACASSSPSPSASESPATPPDATTPSHVLRFVTPVSGACSHYASPAPLGDDSNPGTLALPWATFQHAADTAQPGDTICFRGGGYPTPETHITRSGFASAPITFINAPDEHPTLFNAQDSAANLLTLDPGVAYVRISGFKLESFAIWGIYLAGKNTGVTLDHLDITGGEAGVRFTLGNSGEPPANGPVDHVTFEESVIKDPLYTAVDCTPGPCTDMVFRGLDISGAGLKTGES